MGLEQCFSTRTTVGTQGGVHWYSWDSQTLTAWGARPTMEQEEEAGPTQALLSALSLSLVFVTLLLASQSRRNW